jgi:hypothetical protein
MTLFETLVLVGLGAVVFFLVQVGKTLETISFTCKRWHLESTVRDNMPTLWATPEFSHNNLVTWFDMANGPYNQSLKEKWHWATLEDNLVRTGGPRRWNIPPEEIERLKNLSSEFFHEAELSNLLTDPEIRYLLFYAWNLYLHQGDPWVFVPGDIAKFEDELSNMRQCFFTREK